MLSRSTAGSPASILLRLMDQTVIVFYRPPVSCASEMSLKDRIISKLEIIVITAMQVLMIVVVAVATIVLYIIFVKNLFSQVTQIETSAGLLSTMQQSFAGVLIVVLGLELLETLNTYFTEHHVRLEVILVIAIIAVGRHVIQVDFEHTSGTVLLGLSAVILALTLGYFLIRRPQVAVPPGGGGCLGEKTDKTSE